MIPDDRAEGISDVLTVEKLAPGLARVVTLSGAYVVDARGEGCECPDKEYNLDPGERCKHHAAALLAYDDDLPTPFTVTDNLNERVATDGGERPDDCDCSEYMDEDDLPCFACFAAGFETPATAE